MNKQEFLAMSLPYGLKVKLNQKGKLNLDEEYSEPHDEICEVVNILRSNDWDYEISDDKISYGYIGLDEFDLILHPLSDLTKSIEHKGEKFVPINELKHIFGFEYVYSYATKPQGSFNVYAVCYGCLESLIRWHFDIAHLILCGEAIDVNTLPENPYK